MKTTPAESQQSARWCPLCGTLHSAPKGGPNPWTPHITRKQIEALPVLVASLCAIMARIEGEWDHPALLAYGPLMTTSDKDVLRIAGSALRKAGVR